jgi:uncharacterized membrane protein
MLRIFATIILWFVVLLMGLLVLVVCAMRDEMDNKNLNELSLNGWEALQLVKKRYFSFGRKDNGQS